MSIKINPGVKLGAGTSVKVPILETPHTLTVNYAGLGQGTVVSTPAGINGENQRQATFDYGTVVTLSANSAMGSQFNGWGGDATGTAPAVLTMNMDHTVTADFYYHLATLVAIDITPLNPSVNRDGTIQLTAIGTFSNGGQRDITTRVTWTSANQIIATVSGTGLVTGHSGGSTSIHTSIDGIQGATTLVVGN